MWFPTDLPDQLKSQPLECPLACAPENDRERNSHGDQARLEVFLRNGQVVGSESTNIGLDCFLNIGKGRFLGFALGHTAGQTGALGDH